MFIKRINIFLLSLVMAIAPMSAFAIDPIVGPFTSASGAADLAASLGARATGGWAASAVGAGTIAAAIGVGAGSFCYASMVQGANMCGVSTPICQALTSAFISCTADSNGAFSKKNPNSSSVPDNGQWLYYGSCADMPSACTAAKAVDINTYITLGINGLAPWGASPWTFSNLEGNGDPYTNALFKDRNGTKQQLALGRIRGVHPDPNNLGSASATDVGKAIAGNPGAAAALGAAANAAANSGCAGTIGIFNGVSKCVPALGASNNPSCQFSGIVAGASACAHPAGSPNSGSCAGMFVTVNGVNQCLADADAPNPACSAKLMVLSTSFICVGTDATPSYDSDAAKAAALNAANSAAAASAATPPVSRSCASPLVLNSATNICVNPTIPTTPDTTCKTGYVYSNGTCVAADPLNPTLPAVRTPPTAQQATANAAAATANAELTDAQTRYNTAAAAAAAAPTDQSKADEKQKAGEALNQAQSKANTANLGAIAAKPDTMDFPAFCSWAAIVCDLVGWVKTEPVAPAETETKVTVDASMPTSVQSVDLDKQYVSFGSQCPPDIPIHFSVMGKSVSLALSYSPFCQFLSQLKPFVIAASFIGAVYIVSGSNRPVGDG